MFQEESSSHKPEKIGQGRKPVLPPPGSKWTPEQVHLAHHVTPGGCAQCVRFNPGRSSCELVAGFIQADGVCDYFLGQGEGPDHSASPPPPAPVSKFDSGYVRVKGAEYLCADCAYYQKDAPKTCQIVSGPIAPDDVCWEWAGGPASQGASSAEAATEQATADAVGTESLTLRPPKRSPLRPDHGGDNA